MPRGLKLRADPLARPFRIVLVEPEIPPNTGNAARTAAATGSALHLVGKLGFRVDEHAVRRAGLDYWPLVDLYRNADLDELLYQHPGTRLHLFSASASRSYLEADFEPGDSFVFGRESTGLSPEILERYPERVWAIPTLGPVRSLNLSNCVSIIVYDALRRVGALDSATLRDDSIGSK